MTRTSSGITEDTMLLIISMMNSPIWGAYFLMMSAMIISITIMTQVETTVSVMGNPKR